MSRRAYHHGDLKRALIDTGYALLEEQGPPALAAREAARELDVSVTALYRHFESVDQWRADVSRAAREELARHLLATMDAVPATRAPELRARRRFRACGAGYIDFAIRRPRLFAGAFMACGADPSQTEDPSAAGVLEESLDALVETGAMHSDRREAATIIAWTAVHGMGELIVQGAIDVKTVHDVRVEAVLDGVALALGINPKV